MNLIKVSASTLGKRLTPQVNPVKMQRHVDWAGEVLGGIREGIGEFE